MKSKKKNQPDPVSVLTEDAKQNTRITPKLMAALINLSGKYTAQLKKGQNRRIVSVDIYDEEFDLRTRLHPPYYPKDYFDWLIKEEHEYGITKGEINIQSGIRKLLDIPPNPREEGFDDNSHS